MTIQLEKFLRTKTSVNIRTGPRVDVGGNIIKIFKPGTVLQILNAPVINWYHVRAEDGQEGYMTAKPEFVELYTPAWLPKVQRVVDYGNTKLAVPYKFGSDRTDGSTFDCSDFVQWCYKQQLGIKLPWDSRAQAEIGTAVPIDLKHLRSGDVVGFDTDKDGRINHVALYVYPDLLLQTYNTHCDIKDHELKVIKKGVGGVTWTKFSGYWQNLAVYARRPNI